MTELSQAERTAMERAMLPENRDIPMRSPRLGFKAGWLAASDYHRNAASQLQASYKITEDIRRQRDESRERERELEQEAAAESASHADTITRAEQLVDAGRERERALEKALKSIEGRLTILPDNVIASCLELALREGADR